VGISGDELSLLGGAEEPTYGRISGCPLVGGVRVIAFVAVIGLFPYDSKTDSAQGHSHLILAYCVVWAVHLGYLGYVGIKWRTASKTVTD
jgi:hypothetical protein